MEWNLAESAELAEKRPRISMTENELSHKIIGLCLDIHKQLGPGLLESVYEEILYYELRDLGYYVERQKAVPVVHKEVKMELGFRADLIVAEKVLLELKSVEHVLDVHKKQLLTYLKLTGIKLGLLINFNEAMLKNGITRIVNNL